MAIWYSHNPDAGPHWVTGDPTALPASGAQILYAVIGPSIGWTDPTHAEIVAGTLAGGGAATWSGNVAAPPTTTTFDWPTDATGLTPGVFYRGALVWSDGTTTSNVEVTDAWQATADTTEVSADLGLAWPVRAGVQASLGLSYPVRNAAQSNLAIAWPVRSTVQQGLALSWTGRAGVQASLGLSYQVRNAAQANLGISWAVRNSAQQGLALSWTGRQSINQTLPLSYLVRRGVQQTRSLAWSVLNAAQASLPLAFDVLAPRMYAVIGPSIGWTDPTHAEIVAGTLAGGGAAVWAGNVAAPSGTTVFDWPVDSTGLTPGVFYRGALVWSDGTTTSNVEVTDAWQATALSNPVSADLGLTWIVRSGLQQSLSLAYPVKAGVQSNRPLAWIVRARLQQSLPLAYPVLNSVKSDRTLGYPILTAAQSDLLLDCLVRNGVQVSFPLAYSISGRVQTDLPLAWIVFSSFGVPELLCVNVESAYPFSDAVESAFAEYEAAVESAYPFSNTVESAFQYEGAITAGFPDLRAAVKKAITVCGDC